MATQNGTFNVDDLRQVKYASAVDFGLMKINEVLQADLAFFNSQMNEQMGYLAESLTEQARVWGVSTTNSFSEKDEYGRPVGRRDVGGQTVMFPIKVYATGIGWTEQYMMLATPAELAEKYLAIRRGHAENVILQTKKALFNNVNYTAKDPFTKVDLTVKRLINADSSVIPQYGGVTFDGSSHTHYLARAAALANADIDGAISTITEHGFTNGIKVFINSAQKSAVTALSKFKALDSALIAYNGTTSTITKLDTADFTNQLIGYWDGFAEVWVKPATFIPANYILVISSGEAEKVLGFRQLAPAGLQGLRLKAEQSVNPIICQEAESIFGFGVWNRLGASVLYVGGTSWANPTL